MSIFSLSDATVEVAEFLQQFQAAAAANDVWKGTLTTQTSTALLELGSTIGSFAVGKVLRYAEDAFSETVQSDHAIRAIATMQGIRLTRKLPAGVRVVLQSPASVSITPYTAINVGGYMFFSRTTLKLEAGVPLEAVLYEGTVKVAAVSGIGTNLQTFMSPEDSFVVSDSDVLVISGSTILQKAMGGLWNFEGVKVYADLTHSDGRLLLQFGSGKYGFVPQVTDNLTIVYVITSGSAADSYTVINKRVTIEGYDAVTGIALANPTGGADEKSTLAYKNVESGAFGTYSSAVTKPQYRATVNTYPGIVDAITQAQREVNPRSVTWMNVIRIAALTSSPWLPEQKRAFCDFLQTVTMYAPYFIWQDPIPVGRDLVIKVYCYNTAIPSVVKERARLAVERLFAPQPGILNTNFFESDIVTAIMRACPNDVSYVKVVSPASGEMLVTAPESPQAEASVVPGAGTLPPLLYAYGVSVMTSSGEEGPPSKWVFPQVTTGMTAGIALTWEDHKAAAFYKVWGRKAGSIGLIATLPAGTTSWMDDGSAVPQGGPPNLLSELPIRYNVLRTLDLEVDFSDRQQLVNLG